VAHENGTNEELAALIRRTTEAAKAYIRGDMRTYFALIRHADDYTLMAPFGGEPTRGFEDPSPERLEALGRYISLEQLAALARGCLLPHAANFFEPPRRELPSRLLPHTRAYRGKEYKQDRHARPIFGAAIYATSSAL
jgi:hypothetical protein